MICGNAERPVVRQVINIVGFGLKLCWLNIVAVNPNLHHLFVG